MGTLLIHHAAVLVTMDAERREIQEGGLFIRDGVIEQVGPAAALPVTADEVLNLSGYIVFPGLVNTWPDALLLVQCGVKQRKYSSCWTECELQLCALARPNHGQVAQYARQIRQLDDRDRTLHGPYRGF